ncbi:MAG: type IIL restriction-modification enzyme MmeI [Blastocatellales bacterium]
MNPPCLLGRQALEQRAKVEQCAQAVLDTRAAFPDSTLADLYDPNTMPKRLLTAHQALDAAVDACYRAASFKTELERLEFLFALYRKYTEPLAEMARQTGKKRRSKL